MKLCRHGHAMTKANTYVYPGRNGTPKEACRICRRNSFKRFIAGERIRPVGKKKSKPIPKYPLDGYLASRKRVKCGQCPVTTATRELMDDHRRRFHTNWEDAQWIVRIEA